MSELNAWTFWQLLFENSDSMRGGFRGNRLHKNFVINMLFKEPSSHHHCIGALMNFCLFFLRYCIPLPCCGYDVLKNDCGCEAHLIKHLSSWFWWCMDVEMAHTVMWDLHLGTFGLSFCCSRCRPCVLDNVCSLSFEERWLLLKKFSIQDVHQRCSYFLVWPLIHVQYRLPKTFLFFWQRGRVKQICGVWWKVREAWRTNVIFWILFKYFGVAQM